LGAAWEEAAKEQAAPSAKSVVRTSILTDAGVKR
jgi:hypothetical protein